MYTCRVSELGLSCEKIQCEEGQNFVRFVSENHTYCLNVVSYMLCLCRVSELGVLCEKIKCEEVQNFVRIVSNILYVSKIVYIVKMLFRICCLCVECQNWVYFLRKLSVWRARTSCVLFRLYCMCQNIVYIV